MPKKTVLFMVAILLLIPLASAGASPAMSLDGQLLDSREIPVIIGGQVMVPVRSILQEMGWRVSYNMEEGVVYAEKVPDKAWIFLRRPGMKQNDGEVKLTAAPLLVGGKTLLSLQDVCKLTGAQGTWDSNLELVSFFTPPEMTREGIVKNLLAADRQLMRVEYYNNQAFLKQCRIIPSPKIISKDDLRVLLARYWSGRYIEKLWQAGSENGNFAGFFREGLTPLDYHKEMVVFELGEKQAKVEVKLPLWGEAGTTEFENRVYTLTRDPEGRLLVTDVE